MLKHILLNDLLMKVYSTVELQKGKQQATAAHHTHTDNAECTPSADIRCRVIATVHIT